MRTDLEKQYWDNAALDKDVDIKYISDIPDIDYPLQDLNGLVLEIGCGVGRLLKDEYIGIDISQNMVDIAKNRGKKAFICDGRTIPFGDNTFDYVYSVLVFQHLPLEAVNAYIKEAHRVLVKNGGFVFQFIQGSEDEPFSKHHQLSDLMLNNFKVLDISVGIGHPQWTWVRAVK